MSIHVTDFKWEKGKNDLEYIALLEKNIDVMANKFRECSKVAREQYNKGKADAKSDIAKECKYLLACGMGKKKSLEHLIKILEKEQK